MKCRLCESPLAKMKFALAREEPVAEQSSGPLQTAALVEVLLVRDEHVPDQIRVAEEVDVLRTDPLVGDVAVLGAESRHHHGERIASDLHDELARIARGRIVVGSSASGPALELKRGKPDERDDCALGHHDSESSDAGGMLLMLTFAPSLHSPTLHVSHVNGRISAIRALCPSPH